MCTGGSTGLRNTRRAWFLRRTSVLERMSGPLCDAMLEDEGSAQELEKIERANLFLVPLDNRREWYRYHHLFGQLLRNELERSEPDMVAEREPPVPSPNTTLSVSPWM